MHVVSDYIQQHLGGDLFGMPSSTPPGTMAGLPWGGLLPLGAFPPLPGSAAWPLTPGVGNATPLPGSATVPGVGTSPQSWPVPPHQP